MGEDVPPQAARVYASDLPKGLGEAELWQVFGNYGDIVSIEQVNDSGSEAVFVGYKELEAAKEACKILNYASMRGVMCRCLMADRLVVIRRTMNTGQRLIFEQLDPAIDSCGLSDLCSLFGEVLDCKVEVEEEPGSCGFGFVHFSTEDEAAKAKLFLSGVQLGSSAAEIRPFELADIVLFTGCRYAPPPTRLHARNSDPGASDWEDEAQPAQGTPEDMERSIWQQFQSLEYHYMEVLEDLESKLERLRDLIQLYEPSQERQIVVVAQPANVQPVAGVLCGSLAACDYDSLQSSTSAEDRRTVLEGYETGNLYVVTMSSEVCTRREFDLGRPASVLINFDCPPSLPYHLQRIYKRTGSGTRVHNFFSPTVDSKLAIPLLKALEEAGHDIPPELLELWSRMDQKG
uniref:RRM domain-containing protein n=1 Tax=Alexandrium monilatum TaxID=311494 RepID=A0A7S4RK29_9DINO